MDLTDNHPAPTDSAEFAVIENGELRRFELWSGSELLSVAPYIDSDGNLILPHVETLREHRGNGFGARLMDGLLDVIRADGRSVTPLCGFAAQHIRDNPRHRDLVATRR